MTTALWIIGGIIALILFFVLLRFIVQIAICCGAGALVIGCIANICFNCSFLWGMNVMLLGAIAGGIVGVIISIFDLINDNNTIRIDFYD